ncbi:MAG: hypothetical protein CL609_15265 [Anaerolineaceae bacterium]|nr:hypothetical protein [Anaerolineaceae bacterium]
MNISILSALFISGLLGSFGHCLGMCGPLILMVSAQIKKTGKQAAPLWFLYHGSRIFVYIVLGSIVGGLGSLIGFGSSLSKVAGAFSILLGLGIILFGFSYLGWIPFGKLKGFGWWWGNTINKVMEIGGWRGVIILGFMNGILPCGLVYSALLAAAASGSISGGAAAMFSFGAGTVPVLLVLAMGASSIRQRAKLRSTLTKIAGIFMLLIGTQIILRGLSALHLVSGFKIGKVVLW